MLGSEQQPVQRGKKIGTKNVVIKVVPWDPLKSLSTKLDQLNIVVAQVGRGVSTDSDGRACFLSSAIRTERFASHGTKQRFRQWIGPWSERNGGEKDRMIQDGLLLRFLFLLFLSLLIVLLFICTKLLPMIRPNSNLEPAYASLLCQGREIEWHSRSFYDPFIRVRSKRDEGIIYIESMTAKASRKRKLTVLE